MQPAALPILPGTMGRLLKKEEAFVGLWERRAGGIGEDGWARGADDAGEAAMCLGVAHVLSVPALSARNMESW